MPTVTAKAGWPSVSGSGPAIVARGAAGAAATRRRAGAAVGSAVAAWRSRITGRPAICARRCSRRVAVRSSLAELPRISTSTRDSASSRAASSATQSASESLAVAQKRRSSVPRPASRERPGAWGNPASGKAGPAPIHSTGPASPRSRRCLRSRPASASAKPLAAPASRAAGPWISVSAAIARPPPSALSRRSAPVGRQLSVTPSAPAAKAGTAPRRSTVAFQAGAADAGTGASRRSAGLPSIFAIVRRKDKTASRATADVAMSVCPGVCSCYVLMDSRARPKSQAGR